MRATSAAAGRRAHRLEVVVEHAAERRVRRVAQQPLEVRDAEEAAGGRLERRRGDEDRRRRARGQLGLADEGQGLGDGRVGPQDDRLGRHQAAGGVVPVVEQAAHVVGLFGLHQCEQLLLAALGQLGEQVGGVVGLHRVEDVGGALVVELGEDLHLLVLGHLLEHVGEPLVVERLGHLVAALGQVEQASARSAGFISSRRRAGGRRPAPPGLGEPDDASMADGGSRRGAPRRSEPAGLHGRTKAWATSQSRLRSCSIATSSTVASRSPSSLRGSPCGRASRRTRGSRRRAARSGAC